MTQRRDAKVAFRVDASLEIGTGHVMRCLTLADALAEQGVSCCFICRDHSGNSFTQIRQRGHALIVLPGVAEAAGAVQSGGAFEAELPPHSLWLGCEWPLDADQTRAALHELEVDWLVVDHYALDARWERQLAGTYKRMLVIDDLADRPHICDVLLDQSYGSSPERYAGSVPESCRLLLGPRFALLRPEFSGFRKYSALRRKDYSVKRVLIAMGGVDRPNATGKILDELINCPLPKDCVITIVMGGAAPALQSVRMTAGMLPWRTEVKVNVENMAELMASADLAIGAAGGTSWERCALGLPSVVIATADNQKNIGRSLGRIGAHWYLGELSTLSPTAISSALAHAVNDPSALGFMSSRAQEVCDGLGTKRLVARLLDEPVTLRKATFADGEMLFGWRNHPNVRKHIFNPVELTLTQHLEWLKRTLESSNRRLLVAYRSDAPIGCVRFDIYAQKVEISIYLDPERFGQGLGEGILRVATSWVRKELAEITAIEAKILTDNVASIGAFEAAGYKREYLLYRFEISSDC